MLLSITTNKLDTPKPNQPICCFWKALKELRQTKMLDKRFLIGCIFILYYGMFE